MSEIVLSAGHTVIAVDPAVEMLAELRARLPQVATAVGTAEAIPLPDRSVDAVVAAQAAHWFELSAAAPELARVLRPGGVLGLVWNVTDVRVPWVAALAKLPEDSHLTTEEERIAGSLAQLLRRTVQRAEFFHAHALPPEQLVEGLATHSHVLLLEPVERERLLEAARELFATHPGTAGRKVLEYPYRTFVYQLTA